MKYFAILGQLQEDEYIYEYTQEEINFISVTTGSGRYGQTDMPTTNNEEILLKQVIQAKINNLKTPYAPAAQ